MRKRILIIVMDNEAKITDMACNEKIRSPQSDEAKFRITLIYDGDLTVVKSFLMISKGKDFVLRQDHEKTVKNLLEVKKETKAMEKTAVSV